MLFPFASLSPTQIPQRHSVRCDWWSPHWLLMPKQCPSWPCFPPSDGHFIEPSDLVIFPKFFAAFSSSTAFFGATVPYTVSHHGDLTCLSLSSSSPGFPLLTLWPEQGDVAQCRQAWSHLISPFPMITSQLAYNILMTSHGFHGPPDLGFHLLLSSSFNA